MSEAGPRAVTDGEPENGEVSLEEGGRALLERVRDDLVGNEETRRTVAGAAAVDRVATRAELADLAGRDPHNVSNNDTLDTLDEAGLSLRVPPVTRSTNDEGLYAFYDYQQAVLADVAGADAGHELALPDHERTRRALSYAGAEMVAEKRIETDGDAGATDTAAAPEAGDDADEHLAVDLDDDLRATCEEYGFDLSDGPRTARDRVQRVLEEDTVSVVASGHDADERTVRADLRDVRYRLNVAIETGELRSGAGRADDTDDTDADDTVPDPEAGVLGYDWVRTEADRSWTGRSLRALIYAVLTESDEVGPGPESVDRVELINYGEPTVKGYEVPTDRGDVTLLSDEPLPVPDDEANRHAIDFRIVGALDRDGEDGERLVEDRLEQHLNYVHLLARYDRSMGQSPEAVAHGEEPDNLAADGEGGQEYTDEAARRKERMDMSVPYEAVPDGLWRAMEDTKLDRLAGGYETRVYGSADEVVGTSRSWQGDTP